MTIILYLSPLCTWCKKAKEWLKKKRLPFEERDILEEDEWRDEVLQKSSQLRVPLIDIDGQIIIGFDEPELEKAVAKLKEKNELEKKEMQKE